jgi:hypothetical protein
MGQILLREIFGLAHFSYPLSKYFKRAWFGWHISNNASFEDYSSTDYVAHYSAPTALPLHSVLWPVGVFSLDALAHEQNRKSLSTRQRHAPAQKDNRLGNPVSWPGQTPVPEATPFFRGAISRIPGHQPPNHKILDTAWK